MNQYLGISVSSAERTLSFSFLGVEQCNFDLLSLLSKIYWQKR